MIYANSLEHSWDILSVNQKTVVVLQKYAEMFGNMQKIAYFCSLKLHKATETA